MKIWAKRLLIFGTALGVFISWMFLDSMLAEKVRKEASHAFARSCENCVLEIESVSIPLFNPGRIVFHKLHFTQGVRGRSDVEGSIPKVVTNLSILSLLRREFILKKVLIDSPVITYTDGELPRTPSSVSKKEAPASDSKWLYELNHFALTNGLFTYRRVLHQKTSELKLHHISLGFKPFGSTYGLQKSQIEMSSKFQLENSGEIRLNVTAPVKQKEQLKLDMEVWIKNQNLEDLNVFFKQNDGVVLTGRMIEGHGKVQVRGVHGLAKVKAEYEDFNAKLINTAEQGDLEVFFTNLGIALTTHKRNVKQPKREQMGEYEVDRQEGESIVHFMLIALKQAALEVATN